MAVFVEVVNSGGFSSAADKMGVSPAQVSKSVRQLEDYLGIRLLNRTTRRMSLTEGGRIFYDRCKGILADIAEIEALASEQNAQPQGLLTVSAPTSLGMSHLNPLIADYIRENPAVQVSISLTDRLVDVVAEGFDLVIRIADLEDSSLVARRIAPCRRVFCAAPEYLERHGEPRVPQDLSIHHCLVYSNELRPDTWVLHGPRGIESVKVNGPVCADNGDVLRQAAVAGLGVTLLPTFIVGEELRSGGLKQVLADYSPPDISIHAVFPSRQYLSAKVKSFIEFLKTRIGEQPVWDSFE